MNALVKKFIRIGAVFFISVGSFLVSPAQAYDFSASGLHVTRIEPSYMPDSLNFSVDGKVGNCAAGSYLTWVVQGSDQSSKITNITTVYSALVTAEINNRSIAVFGNNDGCKIIAVWLQ